jgi:FdhE protein
LFTTPIRTLLPSLNAERVRAKLAAGQPLLRGEAFHIDQAAFRQHCETVCAAVGQYQGGNAAGKLQDALEEGLLNPGDVLGDVLGGRPEALRARAEAVGVDPGVATTIFRLLLIPVLVPVDAAWGPVRQEMVWEAGFCPTCGGWPMLGEFRGPEQVRWLRCGLCTAGWVFAGAACPFCGLDDPRFLGSFDVPGPAPCLAATCDACRTYLKMVTTSGPLSGPDLLVADLASMHLDVAAPERGYTAPE